jgi:hypothetical protein
MQHLRQTNLLNLNVLIVVFVFLHLLTAQGSCQFYLDEFGKNLLSMLNKIRAMPPIDQIYTPVKRLCDEAKYAAANGECEVCLNKADLALQYSKPYGGR